MRTILILFFLVSTANAAPLMYRSVSPTTFYTNYYTPQTLDASIIYSGNLEATFDPITLDLDITGELIPTFNNPAFPATFQNKLYITEHQKYFTTEDNDQPFLELQLTDGQNVIMNNPNVWPSIQTKFGPAFSSISLVCIADSLYNGSWLELGNSVYLQAHTPEPATWLLILCFFCTFTPKLFAHICRLRLCFTKPVMICSH